jgi:hypothetical protein
LLSIRHSALHALPIGTVALTFRMNQRLCHHRDQAAQ